MISTIKKDIINNKFSKAIILITVLGFMGVFSLPMLFKSLRDSKPWAIKVNKHEISRQDLVRTIANYQQYIAQIKAQYGQFADALKFDFDPHILAVESLVRDELLIQLAYEVDLFVSNERVMQLLQDRAFVMQNLSSIIPPFLFDQSGEINQEMTALYVSRIGMTMSEFEELIVRAVLKNILVSLLQAAVYVPSYETSYQARMNEASRDFSILSFSLDAYLNKELDTPISAQELESFYEQKNKEARKYWVAEKRRGTAWVFEPKKYNLVISDEAIETYYQENKAAHYVESPAQVIVRKFVLAKDVAPEGFVSSREFIRQKQEELQSNPELFAELVTNFSTDSTLAKRGGLLEPMSRRNQNDPIERAAFTLANDGAVSDIIETDDSYILVQRVEKIPKKLKPLSSVKNDIYTLLLNKEFQETFAQEIQEIMLPHGGYDAEKLERLIQTRNGSRELIGVAEKDNSTRSKVLFSLQPDTISFYSEGKKGVVVRIDGIANAYLPELSSVEDIVASDIRQERARKALFADLEKAVSQLQKKASAKELAESYGVTLKKESLKSGNNSFKGSLFESKGIPYGAVTSLEKKNAYYVHNNDQIVDLVILDSILVPQVSLIDKDNEATKELIAQYQNYAIEGLVASLHRTARIETNESISQTTEDFLYE